MSSTRTSARGRGLTSIVPLVMPTYPTFAPAYVGEAALLYSPKPAGKISRLGTEPRSPAFGHSSSLSAGRQSLGIALSLLRFHNWKCIESRIAKTFALTVSNFASVLGYALVHLYGSLR